MIHLNNMANLSSSLIIIQISSDTWNTKTFVGFKCAYFYCTLTQQFLTHLNVMTQKNALCSVRKHAPFFLFLSLSLSLSETWALPEKLPVTPTWWGRRSQCGWSGSLWFCSSPWPELAARLSAGTSLTSLAWRVCGLGWINDVRPAVLSLPLPVCV